MRRSRIAVAAATATALVGSIAAITLPQAEASSNRPRSVAQAAIATDGRG